jgi:catechol 2,3-dioxygenase-like lactoylglutathione lyase family enzyme
MQVNALDHVNIRTRDIAGTARFFTDVLGLEAREVPALLSKDHVHWLHDRSGRPIIHLRQLDCEPGSTGPIDHVALNCSGKAGFLARVKERGIEHRVHEVSAIRQTLIFLSDPNGVMLELNFRDE